MKSALGVTHHMGMTGIKNDELKASDKRACIATLKIQFRADSGYVSTELLRVRADQWERISAILNEA